MSIYPIGYERKWPRCYGSSVVSVYGCVVGPDMHSSTLGVGNCKALDKGPPIPEA